MIDDTANTNVVTEKSKVFPPFKEFSDVINAANEQAKFYLPSKRISDHEPSKLLHPQVFL